MLLVEGDLDGTAKNLRDAHELIQLGAPGWLRPGLLARQVQYFLAVSNIPEAEALLRQSGVTAGGQVTHATDEIQLAYVRIMLKREGETDLQEGIRLAERVLALAESGQRNNISMQALVLGALIHQKLGDTRSALAWLERALVLAEPEGYIRLFVDEGENVASILQQLPRTEYVRNLLDAFPTTERHSPKPRPEGGLIDTPSEREVE